MKKFIGKVLLVVFSLLLSLLILELVLRTGWFDEADNPAPIWIPHKFKKINNQINQKNWEIARNNPHLFTDKIRDIHKKEGLIRIAVLGNSGIWGYGIPYKLAWNHKLEKKVLEKYQDVEVMSWGGNAWTTMDEVSFLEKHGVKYNIDMLIVSFEIGDPKLSNINYEFVWWHFLQPLRILFPNAFSFVRAHTNNFLQRNIFPENTYENYLKKLYKHENLSKYSELLNYLAIFCDSKNIRLLFILTPFNYDELYREKFNKIIPLLDRLHIEYLDLYPTVKRDLGHIAKRKLWANPGDRHPGTLLTDVYAKEVFTYLEKNNIFSHEEVPHIQELAQKAQGELKDPDTTETLLTAALTDKDWNVRKSAAEALLDISNDFTIKLFTAALKDNDPEIRRLAVKVMGQIKGPRVVDPLIAALEDESSDVRLQAVVALEEIQEPRIVEPLIAALQDEGSYIRTRAALTLKEIKDARAVEPLIASLKDEAYYVRRSAAVALGEIKDPRAVQPLIAILQDEPWYDVRRDAAEALGKIKDHRAVKALILIALLDKHPHVRETAGEALKAITGMNFGRYLSKVRKFWQIIRERVLR